MPEIVTKVVEVARAVVVGIEAEIEEVLSTLDSHFTSPDEHPDLVPFADKVLGPVEDLVRSAVTHIHNVGGTFASHIVSEDGTQTAIEAHTAENGDTGAKTSVYKVSFSDEGTGITAPAEPTGKALTNADAEADLKGLPRPDYNADETEAEQNGQEQGEGTDAEKSDASDDKSEATQ